MYRIVYIYFATIPLLLIFTAPLSVAFSKELFKDNERHILETHGYLRHGYGRSNGGDTQVSFSAPGAGARYRLGNEPDFNVELLLQYTYLLEKANELGPSIRVVYKRDEFRNRGELSKSGLRNIAESYVSLDNINNSGVNFWLGRRYYERKEIHIIDYNWLNSGQRSNYGFGLQSLNLFNTETDIALFTYEDSKASPINNSNSSSSLDSYVLDLRLRNIELTSSSLLTLWSRIAYRDNNNSLGYSSKSGFAGGFWVDYNSLFDGKSTLSVNYSQGAAIAQGAFNSTPIREDQGYDLDDAFAFEINNDLLVDILPTWSMQALILYRFRLIY